MNPVKKQKIEPENMSWRDRIKALRFIPPFFLLVWQTSRGYFAAMLILRLLRAGVPIAALWVGKLIIDSVLTGRTSQEIVDNPFGYSRLWQLVALEIGIVISGEILSRASSLVESLASDLFSNRISIKLMQHAAKLDLYQFENPEFYDRLERARRQTTGRIGLVPQIFQIVQDALTLSSLAVALFVFNPWLLLLLVLAVIPSFWGTTHFAALEYSLLYRWTPERRLLDYYRFLGASDRTAKEVQMFGLSNWLIERYHNLSTAFYNENRRLSIRRGISAAALSIVGTLGYYSAYAAILLQAVTGAITIGSLTFLAASFQRSRGLIENLLDNVGTIFSQSLYLKDLFDFFDTEPTIKSVLDARKVPQVIRDGFVFENVGFRYPESENWAIRNVSFTLKMGERIALVGENGAGKTTLTKLIARLYDPTEGRILLDGVDLREYDLESLRSAISVIFQDFVRYDLAFNANIGVGEIEQTGAFLSQTKPDSNNTILKNGDKNLIETQTPQSIIEAADKSLAATLLPKLADGYGQMLGRRFDGGVDLSGGEWQKVALGRAYMRQAKLLILDEPTAALDARAEFEVFERFSNLVRGRMAILISHRFSTVRMADRIIVLQGGTVAEEGTHTELVDKCGVYAELFKLQAKGYK